MPGWSVPDNGPCLDPHGGIATTETQDEATGLILPVSLPPALEALRCRAIPDARLGLPAHVTLLYPFVPVEALDDNLRDTIQQIVAGADAFEFRLAGRGTWPDVAFATVEPELPFRALHEAFAGAYPSLPIYRGAFEFAPHVTLAEGHSATPAIAADPAWTTLPSMASARFVDLIVREPDGWHVRWRFGLR